MGDFNINLLKYDCCNVANQFFNQLSSSGAGCIKVGRTPDVCLTPDVVSPELRRMYVRR